MSKTNYINETLDNNVLIIEACRNDKKNALTTAMYHDLAEAFNGAAANSNINAIVFSGGENFSAGNDLADFLENPPLSLDAPVFQAMKAISHCPQPIVTAVDGVAVGIGTTVLLHTDINYCSNRARFAMPFVNLGVVPEYASSMLLPQRAGYNKAAELLMLGEPFDSLEALNAGLVNRILPPEELREQALATAHKLAAKPRTALIQSKSLLKGNLGIIDQCIAREAAVFGERLQSEESRQIMAAFFNKKS